MSEFKLQIKPAAEYRIRQEEAVRANKNEFRKKAVDFINNEITPKIENKISTSTTTSECLSVVVPVYHRHASEMVNEISELLLPLGYNVRLSHDGGGMYQTVIVKW